MPAPIFYKYISGLYLGCNTGFEKYIGLSKDNIIGKSVYDIAPKNLADIYYSKYQELFRKPDDQIYETSVVDADGTRH
ncbi:MAG TPA: PAS domain S-box protein, partial [Candidatus Brocadiaceae bacterium]